MELTQKQLDYLWVKELKEEVLKLKRLDKDKGLYKFIAPEETLLDDKYNPTVDLNRLHKLLVLCERLGVKRLNFHIINNVRPIEIYNDIPDIRFILAPIRTW